MRGKEYLSYKQPDKKFKKHVRKAGKILKDGLELPNNAATKNKKLKKQA